MTKIIEKIQKMPVKTVIIIVAVLGCCIACNRGTTVYNQYRELPEQGWNKDSAAHFDFAITDTGAVYTLLLNLRHQNNYGRQNLWLFTAMESPDGKVESDTLNVILADNTGRWFGSGFGSLRQMPVLFQKEAKFPLAGSYHFAVKQGMRDSLLTGISDVGWEVIKN